MGSCIDIDCQSDRTIQSVLTNLLCDFGFRYLKVNDVKSLFREYENSSIISEHNMKKKVRHFGKRYSKLYQILKHFHIKSDSESDEKIFCLKKIRTLGVALGDDNIDNRISELFTIYCDGKEFLTKDDVRAMIYNIMHIHLYVIPIYVLELDLKNKRLNEFFDKVISYHDKMIENTTNLIANNFGEMINFDEFKNNFSYINSLSSKKGQILRDATYKFSLLNKQSISKNTFKSQFPLLRNNRA